MAAQARQRDDRRHGDQREDDRRHIVVVGKQEGDEGRERIHISYCREAGVEFQRHA